MGSYLKAMAQSFDFSGRTSRSAYWYFQLVMIAVIGAAVFAEFKMGSKLPIKSQYGSISLIASLLHVAAATSITVRRLHDIGRSGWWYLLCFVPLGAIVLLVWSCLGSDDDNDYGNTPDRRNSTAGRSRRYQTTPVVYRGVRTNNVGGGYKRPGVSKDGIQRFI